MLTPPLTPPVHTDCLLSGSRDNTGACHANAPVLCCLVDAYVEPVYPFSALWTFMVQEAMPCLPSLAVESLSRPLRALQHILQDSRSLSIVQIPLELYKFGLEVCAQQQAHLVQIE